MQMVGLPLLFELDVVPPPIEWIESAVDLSTDPTSAASGLVKLDPYQVEPIEAQFLDDIHEVVAQQAFVGGNAQVEDLIADSDTDRRTSITHCEYAKRQILYRKIGIRRIRRFNPGFQLRGVSLINLVHRSFSSFSIGSSS